MKNESLLKFISALVISVVHCSCCFSMIVVNDSGSKIRLFLYNDYDHSHSIEGSRQDVDAFSMLRFNYQFNKFQIGFYRLDGNNKEVGIILLPSVKRIYTNAQTIVVSANGYITPPGQVHLEGIPQSAPHPIPSGASIIDEGQGAVVNRDALNGTDILKYQDQFILNLTSGGNLILRPINASTVLWSSNTEGMGVKYIHFAKGILYLQTEGFHVVRKFSGFAGDSKLELMNGWLRVVKPRFFLVWKTWPPGYPHPPQSFY